MPISDLSIRKKMLWLKATIARSAVRYHLKNAPALQGFLPIGATRFLGQNYPGALVGVAVSKRMTPNAAIGLALAAVIAVEGSALAQYDRDGRYVPSPMGVPQDPYAAPIPMYPGTPGGAVGTPALPRAAFLRPRRCRRSGVTFRKCRRCTLTSFRSHSGSAGSLGRARPR